MKKIVVPFEYTRHTNWLDFVGTWNTRSKLSITARDNRRLSEFCYAHSIPYRVSTEADPRKGTAIQKKRRHADLQLIDTRHFLDNLGDRLPNSYGQKTLDDAGCPVLMLPPEPSLPGTILLAYDGTPGSIRAMRQFSRLFPEFSNIPTTLVHVDEKVKGAIPRHPLIHDLGN
jgi:hypothetical protein